MMRVTDTFIQKTQRLDEFVTTTWTSYQIVISDRKQNDGTNNECCCDLVISFFLEPQKLIGSHLHLVECKI